MIPYDLIAHVTIGSLRLPVWGLFVSLAFLVSLVMLSHVAAREGISQSHVVNLVLGVLVSSMIGARVTYLADHAREIESVGEALMLWDGGLGMLGGMAGGLGFLVWYVKVEGLEFWKMSDIVSRVLPLGIAVGRLGCHFIGDHPGKPTGGEWGFVKWDGIAYHEPAIYEAVLMLGLFLGFALWDVVGRSKNRARGDGHVSRLRGPVLAGHLGAYTLVFVIAYAWMRLVLDFARAGDPLYLGLTLSQYASIAMIVTGLLIGWRIYLRGTSEQQKNGVGTVE